MKKGIDKTEIPQEILSHPYVKHLHKVIEDLVKEVEILNKKVSDQAAEIAKLKKVPEKPDIKASKLDEVPKKPRDRKKGREGQKQKKKKKDLPVDETRKIEASEVPQGWKLVGYKPYIVQDIVVRRNNIKYEREIWESPDGKQRIIAPLPQSIAGRDFGGELRRYVISLYNECHVTQPIIYAHLKNLGVDISTGSINFILNEDSHNEVFAEELMDLVGQGIAVSDELRTDDTGARHRGKNGFCNCPNTDLFTYFVSSGTKSRINFLRILQLNREDYHLNEVALAYFRDQKLGPKYMDILQLHEGAVFEDEQSLKVFLHENQFSAQYALRTIYEGLMVGSLVEHGFDPQKIIHSDGAAQFHLFLHSLCWKHVERPLLKLHIHNDKQQEQWDKKMTEFWQLYQDLKAYKNVSSLAQKRRKTKLDKQFDELCEPVVNFEALNMFLEDLKKKKQQMLVVLEFPTASLHNNSTERQIREYSKRRKISGSTRSENGRKFRDVFTSLKKSCKKLGVNFWDYLYDRITGENKIPPLDQILIHKAHINV